MGWCRDAWTLHDVHKGAYSLSIRLSAAGSDSPWWITTVYGPQDDAAKVEFLDELRSFRAARQGAWMVCGDFNLTYHVEDKNNDRIDRRAMRRFRSFLDSVQLQKLDLIGRRYTWTNGQVPPTLVRQDRAFA